MNRRDFIRTTAAAAVAALVPTWLRAPEKPKLNLQAFCDVHKSIRYDMTKPFTQETAGSFVTYATDSKCIVKVAGDWQKEGTDDARLPPAERLWWDHDTERGWKPWPKQDWIIGDSVICFQCRGTGGDGHINECDKCDGFGNEYTGEGDGPIKCVDCNGTGTAKPYCPVCHGRGTLTKGPRHQVVGHAQIACEYDRLLRKECGEMEYVIIHRPNATRWEKSSDLVLFRFAEGTGILAPMTPEKGA